MQKNNEKKIFQKIDEILTQLGFDREKKVWKYKDEQNDYSLILSLQHSDYSHSYSLNINLVFDNLKSKTGHIMTRYSALSKYNSSEEFLDFSEGSNSVEEKIDFIEKIFVKEINSFLRKVSSREKLRKTILSNTYPHLLFFNKEVAKYLQIDWDEVIEMRRQNQN